MGLTKYIREPWLIPIALQSKGLGYLIPDTLYLQCAYYNTFGKKLNLKNPKTFNEKLQWLKLYDRKPIYTTMVDKYAAKKYVADIIGEEYIIPTLGVWDRFEDIDFTSLPNQFVLKCTHDSGGLVICKDKSMLNIEDARRKINDSLKRDYYLNGREWPYKNVPRRIIAEKYMSKSDGSIPEDYKVLNFNGNPGIIQVDLDRFINHKKKLFLPNWTELNFDFNYPTEKEYSLKKPDTLTERDRLARKLSKEFSFLRTDFYVIDDRIYFGELTLFPASGFGKFSPEEWDERIGKWISLPEKRGGVICGDSFFLYIHEENEDSDVELHGELIDYKVFCFNGRPEMTLVCTDRYSATGLCEDFFDNNWVNIPVKRPNHRNSQTQIKRPHNHKQLLCLAEKLSHGTPFLRVDFYEINGNVYFGEMTFYPASGFEGFEPESWDTRFGEKINLP